MTHQEDFAALSQSDSWRNQPDRKENKVSNNDAADECASCQKILEGVADVLHNQLKDRSAEQAIGALSLYGAVGDKEMRAAAKVLRSVATCLRVREIKLREGKL
jgi:hypothetical protein